MIVCLASQFPSVQGIGCNKINVENDSDNFLAFVETLRTALGPASRISAAIPIGGIKGPDGALYSKTGELAKYLDYSACPLITHSTLLIALNCSDDHGV